MSLIETGKGVVIFVTVDCREKSKVYLPFVAKRWTSLFDSFHSIRLHVIWAIREGKKAGIRVKIDVHLRSV